MCSRSSAAACGSSSASRESSTSGCSAGPAARSRAPTWRPTTARETARRCSRRSPKGWASPSPPTLPPPWFATRIAASRSPTDEERSWMNPELVRRFHEAIVYEAESQDGVPFVLRISHSTRRSFDYTMGEIEFVRYLGAAGIPVAQPILSEAGQFVERIADTDPDHHFVATAFERADGIVFDDAPPLKELYWKPPMFRDLGRIFARLHNRAQTYKLSNPRFKRQEWYEYDVVDIDRFAPPEEQLVRDRTARIIERLKQLPRTPEGYGLIHA